MTQEELPFEGEEPEETEEEVKLTAGGCLNDILFLIAMGLAALFVLTVVMVVLSAIAGPLALIILPLGFFFWVISRQQ